MPTRSKSQSNNSSPSFDAPDESSGTDTEEYRPNELSELEDTDEESDTCMDKNPNINSNQKSMRKRKNEVNNISEDMALSKSKFDEQFEKKFLINEAHQLKYPTRRQINQYIDMLSEDFTLSDVAFQEERRIYARTQRQYTIVEKNGDKKKTLMSKGTKKVPSALIVAREDIFETLFKECIAAKHNIKNMIKRTV